MTEWNIMVYMNADHTGFEEPAKNNFEQLGAIGSSESINVLVLLDRSTPAGKPKPDDFYPAIYKVEKGARYPPSAPPLKSLGEEFDNMGSSRTLSTFLEYCKTNHPARKNMLVIWDHGGGISAVGGIGDDDARRERLRMNIPVNLNNIMESPGGEVARLVRRAARRQHAGNSFLHVPKLDFQNRRGDTEPDPDKDSPLYVTEIAACLAKHFPDKLDVLIFDACWMQTLENAYTLKDRVHYVVGSEGTFSVSGMGYTELLLGLLKNPGCTPREAGRLVVEGTAMHQSHAKRLTVSSLDVMKVNELVTMLEKLGDLCLQANDVIYKPLRFSRFLCLPFYLSENGAFINIQVIDLPYFLEKFCGILSEQVEDLKSETSSLDMSPENKSFLGTCDDVIPLLKRMIFRCHSDLIAAKSIGTVMATHETDQTFKCWGAKGVSIFFPEHYFQWDEYKKGNEWYFLKDGNRLPFVTGAPKWISFLEKYFKWQEKEYIEVL